MQLVRAGILVSVLGAATAASAATASPLPARRSPAFLEVHSESSLVSLGDRPSLVDTSLGGNELWWGGFAPPGAAGKLGGVNRDEINAAVLWNGRLVVAGDFGYLDGVRVPGLARWVGSRWEPLESVPPLDTGIRKLEVYRGSLFAGGARLTDDGASCLYRWEDDRWVPEGDGAFLGPSTAIGVLRSSGDRLFVWGSRYESSGDSLGTSHFLEEWDGAAWTSWSLDGFDPLEDAYVFDLLLFQDRLFLAGDLGRTGTGGTRTLVSWNGTSWEDVSGGFDGPIRRIESYAGRLVAAGSFATIDGDSIAGIAQWDGSTWSALGGGLGGGRYGVPMVSQLLVHDGRLVVLGLFESAGGEPAGSAAAWNGSEWIPLGSLGPVRRPTVVPRVLVGLESRILAGGTVWIGTQYSSGFVSSDGGEWRYFPPRPVRLNERPSALLPSDAGLIAAGEFSKADVPEATLGIGIWDGSGWRLIAQDMDDHVLDLTWYEGRLVAGGLFQTVNGVAASYVAQWDGTSWAPLGEGTDGPVLALEVYHGRLIVGGEFGSAGGISASRIAGWDGHSWIPLGAGIAGSDYHWVSDLEVYGKDLVVAGCFGWAGDRRMNHVARWDGNAWAPLGDPEAFQLNRWFNSRLEQVVRWNGRLVVQGLIPSVSGEQAHDLAIWDQGEWRPLTPRLTGLVSRIGVCGGNLLVGGWIDLEGGDSLANTLLQWDGTRWYRMGDGVWSGSPGAYMYPALSASAVWRRHLYVGGYFEAAGDKVSHAIARWDGVALTALLPPPMLAVSPNPARESVAISYLLEDPGPVTIDVYDVQGRKVARVLSEDQLGGPQTAAWDLRESRGRRVTAGVYFVRLRTRAGSSGSRLMVLGRE